MTIKWVLLIRCNLISYPHPCQDGNCHDGEAVFRSNAMASGCRQMSSVKENKSRGGDSKLDFVPL